MPRLSWRNINFDRWRSFAAACVSVDGYASANLTNAIARLEVCWKRLRDDLDALFQPSGPPGTHAHYHYHAPADPEVRERVLAACVVDYESALMFLDVALDLSVRCAAKAAGFPIGEWRRLVKAAEQGEAGLPTTARRQILYLQRAVLFARNKAVAHPLDLVAFVQFDNVGNLTFERSPLAPDSSLMQSLDEMLHRVMPEIRPDAHVGRQIAPRHALTWISSRSDTLNDADRKLFEDLRVGFGYSLPSPTEVAEVVDEMVELFVEALPANEFNEIALAKVHSMGEGEAQQNIVEPAVPGDPIVVERLINAGIAAGNGGDHHEALTSFARALELDPDNGAIHMYLGKALIALGQLALALDSLYKAVAVSIPMAEVKDDLVQAHFNLGAESFNSGRYAEAVANYSRVCELRPDDVEARRHLAVALAKQGRIDRALLEAAQLDRDHPEDNEALHDVCRVLQASGNPELALKKLEQAKGDRPV